MFQIVNPDAHVNFIRLRTAALVFSGILILAGIGSLVAHGGPNYGIDFTGGLMLHVGFEKPVSIEEVRGAVDGLDLGEISVQIFGDSGNEFLLRIPSGNDTLSGGRADQIKDALRSALPNRGLVEKRTEMVGPKVGRELRERGILSVFAATIMMGLYIAVRFQLRFGIGAGVALLHDVLITVGALSLANMEVNLSVIAGLLTVVGYSVNDTVVVSDRIRENMARFKKAELSELINRSINETLSRTILTTGTSLLVLFALFVFGGGVIRGFAFTLIVGLTIGTYSSIFIASPVVEIWESRQRTKAS